MKSIFYWGYEETLLFSFWQTHGPISFALSTAVLFGLCLLSAWLKLRCHEVEERRGIVHTSAVLNSSECCCSCNPSPRRSSIGQQPHQQMQQDAMGCAVEPLSGADSAVASEGSRPLPCFLPYADETRRPLAAEVSISERKASARADTSMNVTCAAAGSLHPASCSHSSSTSSGSSSSGSTSCVYAAAEHPSGEAGDLEEDKQWIHTRTADEARGEEKTRKAGVAFDGEPKVHRRQRDLCDIGVGKAECPQQQRQLPRLQHRPCHRTETLLTIESWLLTFLAAAIDWGLMLVCMTFNAGLFLAIMGGIATGRALTSASLTSPFSRLSWLQQQEQHG